MGTPSFLLGRLVATPGALNAFAATDENPINYIVRHRCGTCAPWASGMRVFSA
jgi:hypothetical protein